MAFVRMYLLVVMLVLTSLPLSALAINDVTDPVRPAEEEELESFSAKAESWIASQNINVSIGLFSHSLVDGLNLAAKYRLQTMTGFEPNTYARLDTWTLKTELDTNKLMGFTPAFGTASPVYLNVSSGIEIAYLRQFSTKKKALHWPKMPWDRIPLTAENAMKHMEVGDLFSMPMNLNMVTGLQIAGYTPGLTGRAFSGYVLKGGFTVQVFKTARNRVRLRMFARSSHGTQEGVKSEFDLKFMGIPDWVEDGIKQLVNLNIMESTSSKTRGEAVMFDYIFNLDQPEARLAYDKVLNTRLLIGTRQMTTQMVRNEKAKEAFLSDLRSAEVLALADKDADESGSSWRVKRYDLVEDKFTQSLKTDNFGLLIMEWKNERSYIENFVSYTDVMGSVRSFFNPIFVVHKVSDNNFPFIGDGKSDTRRALYSILGMNPDTPSFESIGMIYDRKEDRFGHKEQAAIRQLLFASLTLQQEGSAGPDDKSLFADVHWGNWGWDRPEGSFNPYTEKLDTRINFRLVLRSEAIVALQARFPNRDKLLQGIRPLMNVIYGEEETSKKVIDSVLLAKALDEAINGPSLSPQERVRRLFSLRNAKPFKVAFLGLFTTLFSREELTRFGYFKFQMWGKDRYKRNLAPIEFTFGRANDPADIDHRIVDDLDAVLNERAIDPRLFTPHRADAEDVSDAVFRTISR